MKLTSKSNFNGNQAQPMWCPCSGGCFTSCKSGCYGCTGNCADLCTGCSLSESW